MNPLAEVFGFPTPDLSDKAVHYRTQKLCPFNNKVPNCTKDKANDPLGVCSVHYQQSSVITCPIRFREDWIIVSDAARFLFPDHTNWTSLAEVRLLDRNGQSAGNIDFVLVAYDEHGRLVDFGSLEVQAVYISGNLRNPFVDFMSNFRADFQWKTGYNYPKPDYLSSSRKRLVPQMLYKGGILKSWNKRQVVALQQSFFATLPPLPQVERANADIAWLLYDLVPDTTTQSLKLTLVDTVYTEFGPALDRIISPEPGDIGNFVSFLQSKLDERLEGFPPEAPTLNDIIQ